MADKTAAPAAAAAPLYEAFMPMEYQNKYVCRINKLEIATEEKRTLIEMVEGYNTVLMNAEKRLEFHCLLKIYGIESATVEEDAPKNS